LIVVNREKYDSYYMSGIKC